MHYPYQTPFVRQLSATDLSPATVRSIDQSVTQFFSYLRANNTAFAANPTVDNLFDRDVTAYFDELRHQGQLRRTTENKLLSHLNRYFQYLFTHSLTTHLPTLALHGPQRPAAQPQQTKWLPLLPTILSDQRVHFYTRLTLLLISKGYRVGEILQPGFVHEWQTIPLNTSERQFQQAFMRFITPLQARQQSSDLFLKQRLDLTNPHLTNAALHKYLKKDAAYLGFDLSPTRLYQSYVIQMLREHPTFSDQELEDRLRLDPQALLYYKQLQLKWQ